MRCKANAMQLGTFVPKKMGASKATRLFKGFLVGSVQSEVSIWECPLVTEWVGRISWMS